MISRVAIFVDAGYLFAQGSTCLTGAGKKRTDLKLNETAAIAELTSVAKSRADGASLLRIYWYDGVVGFKGPTLQQTDLANLDNVKLRLGLVNSYGQQKGVDSLIVTDLIELARNQAITDALLLSGDEDVRIGVQIAQNFGVRIHLLGIHPSRGSQSKHLIQEADTTAEWDKATVAKFLSVLAPVPAPTVVVAALGSPASGGSPTTAATMPASAAAALAPAAIGPLVDTVAETMAHSLDTPTIMSLKAYWASKANVPPEFDGKLLARSRAAIGRDLTFDEKKHVRAVFKTKVQAR